MAKDWQSVLILPEVSIVDAIKAIDKSGLRLAVVVDKDRAIGVLSKSKRWEDCLDLCEG